MICRISNKAKNVFIFLCCLGLLSSTAFASYDYYVGGRTVPSGSTSTVTDNTAISTRSDATDWTQSLDVDVTPAADGWIDFKIELLEYEANDEVYIWPEVEIS